MPDEIAPRNDEILADRAGWHWTAKVLSEKGMSDFTLDPTQLASQEQFTRQSQRYGKGHILENVGDLAEALGFIHLPEKSQVLDVACGAGHTGLHLASLGHLVTCTDLSWTMLERTREMATARGLRVEINQHPAEALPYADGSFDLVTCRIAPHHFTSPGKFVSETARVLRSGGWLVVIDGTIPSADPSAGEWLNQIEKLRDPSHVRVYSPDEWRGFCQQCGLRLVHHWIHHKKQPDLEWYFETAATPPENRQKIRALIAGAPSWVRDLYQLGDENGKIVWQWPILSLLAQK